MNKVRWRFSAARYEHNEHIETISHKDRRYSGITSGPVSWAARFADFRLMRRNELMTRVIQIFVTWKKARKRCRLRNNSHVGTPARRDLEGAEERGGQEAGKRRGERWGSWHAFDICKVTTQTPTLVHLIEVVGKICNALISHWSHAELFPITIAHEIDCIGTSSSA